MRAGVVEIFQETYSELRPGTSLPELKIEFFAFANVNNTIRLRNGRLLVRLSDLLEGAPDAKDDGGEAALPAPPAITASSTNAALVVLSVAMAKEKSVDFAIGTEAVQI